MGYHRIPVDDLILQETIKLGFEHNFTKKCIEANRHNDATTTYYLLLKKFVRDGGISKVYLGSKYFDATLIEPIRRIVPDCILSSIQQPSPSIRPLPTSTLENLRLARKIVVVIPASEGRLITWPIQQESSEISLKDKIQPNDTIALDNFILPVIN